MTLDHEAMRLDAEAARLRNALIDLTRDAGDVQRLGSSLGPQWLKMAVSLMWAKTALKGGVE